MSATSKPVKRNIVIQTWPGYDKSKPPVPVEVEAEVYGDLIAVHPALHYKNVAGWDRYAVTHIPTSLCLGWFSLVRVAKAYAKVCEALIANDPSIDEPALREIAENAYRRHKFLDGTDTTGV